MSRHPLIVTTYAAPPQTPPWLIINRGYAKAIEACGGTLVMLTNEGIEHAEKMGELMDGLLLPGGGDINPHLYHKRKKPYTENIHTNPDTVECALFHIALRRKIPILGICRGMQMMNVCQGGTLYQDISREFNNSIKHLNVIENSDQNHIAHDITIEQNSKLYTILGKEKVAVNSVHHQGIAKLGTNIVISATASDGVVEAIEIPTQPFAIGIEWHPERLIKDKVWLKLFEAFVEATRN